MPMIRTGLLLLVALVLAGCDRPPTRVEVGDRDQVLYRGNGTEPQDIDPQTVSGVPEDHIITALFEGLVSEDPHDLHPVPGVAERWELSEDQKTYTFHFRKNARWSNGDPVTAQDFVQSFKRMLAPTLASEYAYMLYVMKNAERYNTNGITDFSLVGAKALDDSTLQISLNGPTPYFLSLINHYSWYPVPIATIKRCGPLDERGNRWTRPENFVCNGPFVLSKWRINDVIVVRKSPTYWDREKVKLQEVRFYPIESLDTEERAFRARQLHVSNDTPLPKIDSYKEKHPDLIRIDAYLGTYIYRLNVTHPGLTDKRVRKALAMALDREAISTEVVRAGQIPAHSFTPPGTAGYQPPAVIFTDVERAKKLLAEAGYPNGQGFPRFKIQYNTLESHRAIAEAVQQMWKKNLNIDVDLENQEWKVYIDNQRTLNYDIGRYAWIGDYVDPNSFLDMFLSNGGNNQTGWKNAEFDSLLAQAGQTGDMQKRFAFFAKAEAILLDEVPMIPIYHYTHAFLIQPSLHGWYPNLLDRHPYKYVWLEPLKNLATGEKVAGR